MGRREGRGGCLFVKNVRRLAHSLSDEIRMILIATASSELADAICGCGGSSAVQCKFHHLRWARNTSAVSVQGATETKECLPR